MRILALLFFAGILSGCSGNKKNTDCARFRNGNFIHTISSGVVYEIERTEIWQAEYNPATDTLVVYDIKWTGDCTYEVLKKIKGKKSELDTMATRSIKRLNDTLPLKVRITGVAEEYYTFESSKDGIDFVYKDTMWVNKKVGGFKSMGDTFH
jgi:hypothetical protein